MYRGTIAELVAQNISLNGKTLGSADWSVITRLGKGSFANEVGKVKKVEGSRGKPSTVWEINPVGALNFTVPTQNGGAVIV